MRITHSRPSSPFVGITLAALAGATSPAPAADFAVDTTADTVDADPGDGVCADAGGGCSLRAAVMEANTAEGPHTISIPAGLYELTIAPQSTNNASTGDLNLTKEISIVGAGPSETIIDVTVFDRAFRTWIPPVALTGLTIRGGLAGGDGGAVWGENVSHYASLTLTDVVLSDNTCSGAGGAVAHRSGSLTLLRCVVTGNSAGTHGAGIHCQINNGGQLTMVDSIVSSNTAMFTGGGLYLERPADITGSTIAGNSANWGGGIWTADTLILTNSTLSDNFSQTGGGGIVTFGVLEMESCTITGNMAFDIPGIAGGFNTIHNTILAGNVIPGGLHGNCCCSPITSLGHNVIGDNCDITGDETGNIYVNDPMLGPLQDNGGPTPTHAPLPGSPALEGGDPDDHPPTDQRGAFRPGGAAPEIGAYEDAPIITDCNGNLIDDAVDIGDGTSADCNGNGVPDECDLDDLTSLDCNGNGVPDECDIADGMLTDADGSGVADECESSGDFSGDGSVDLIDLLTVIFNWGVCPPGPCPGDADGDGVVSVSDLLTVIFNWS